MRPSALFGLLATATAVFAAIPTPPIAEPAIVPRQTTAPAAATPVGPLVCSTATTTSGKVCSVIAVGTSSKTTCSTAVIPTSVCAEGLICFTEGTLTGQCMNRDNTLTMSGLIVTIVFVVCLIGTIAVLIGMAYMEKSKAKKLARERAALLGGSKRAMEDLEVAKPYKIGGGGDSGADEPLTKKAAPPGSSTVPQMKLHQGIGALGGQNDEHWSNDYTSSGNAQQQSRMV